LALIPIPDTTAESNMPTKSVADESMAIQLTEGWILYHHRYYGYYG
jgi:hypothetical protein